MGILQYLGLDDLADSVNELTSGLDELREEIVSSVIGPGEELKQTIHDIANSVSGETKSDATSTISETTTPPPSSQES